VSPPALLAAVVALFVTHSDARAHRLNAQAFLLPDKRVQVESWFSTGEVPRGASVEVLDQKQQLLTSGQLNDKGIFVFSYAKPEPLTVVVAAGAGHRAEVSITSQELAQAARSQPKGDSMGASRTAATSSEAIPIGVHDSGVPIKDMLIGVSFLLALAAFVLSWRNARKLKNLKSGG
jgi:nickel transport protein